MAVFSNRGRPFFFYKKNEQNPFTFYMSEFVISDYRFAKN